MTIASLVVTLSAQVSDFHDKLEEAGRHMEQIGRRITRAGTEISEAISPPILAAGAAAFKAALEESARSFGPLYTAWAQLKAAVVALFTAIGRQLTPVFLDLITAQRAIVEQGRRLLEFFQGLPPGVQKAITSSLLFLAALGPTVFAIGKLVKVIGAVPSLFAALSSPIGLAIVAVAAFAAAGLYVVTHWEQVQLKLVLFWTAIKEAVFDAVSGILGVLQTLTGWVPILGDAIKKLKANFDAWTDDSLAAAAARIQQLQQGVERANTAVKQQGALLPEVIAAIAAYNEGMRELAVNNVVMGPRFNAFAMQAQLLKTQIESIGKASPAVRAQFEATQGPPANLAAKMFRAEDAATAYNQGLTMVAAGLLTFAQAAQLADRVASGALSLAGLDRKSV